MTPREKVLRDFAESVVRTGPVWRQEAREALAAADAIPDAPTFETLVSRVCELPTTGLASAESPRNPSRAELIELMCGAWSAEFSVSIDRLHMARVLDALVKAGAVKHG